MTRQWKSNISLPVKIKHKLLTLSIFCMDLCTKSGHPPKYMNVGFKHLNMKSIENSTHFLQRAQNKRVCEAEADRKHIFGFGRKRNHTESYKLIWAETEAER
jgi:hypothetical protein